MTQRFERLAISLAALLVGAVVTQAMVRPPVAVSYAPIPAIEESAAEAATRAFDPKELEDGAKIVQEQSRGDRPRGQNARLAYREVSPPKPSVERVVDYFQTNGYTLASIQERGEAPRILMTSLPAGLAEMRDIDLRKRVFFRTMLPLVLEVNEEILADRRRLWRLMRQKEAGIQLGAVDQIWLGKMASRYRTDKADLQTLFKRVDIIPPSLAIAQAAKESGWGTSRFSQQGNALFGQWTWSDDAPGITPLGRDEGKTHRIRAFDNLLASVRAYALNLNRHRAYTMLRDLRLEMREAGEQLDGSKLADGLLKYSEIGQRYVDAIRSIINANRLAALDALRLADEPVDEPAI